MSAPLLRTLDAVRLRVSDRTSWLMLRVRGDDDLAGLGEASMSGDDGRVQRAMRRLFDAHLRGRLVTDCGQLIGRLRAVLGAYPDKVEATAMSGLEQALWDLRGQQLGVPVHALLGGARRGSVALYANINRGLADRSPEGFAERAAAAAAGGHGAVKCAPFDGLTPAASARRDGRDRLELGVRRVAAVRQAVGDAVAVMVDCHGRLDVDTAVALAPRLAELGVRWYEEPVRGGPPDGGDAADARRADLEREAAALGRVAAAGGVPLAGGEGAYGLEQFDLLLRGGALRHVMPDVKHCGGLWETVRVGALAELHGALVAPHNPSGPLATLASLHVVAALDNFDLLEYQWGEVGWRARLLDPPERVAAGQIAVPDRPGLGATLDPGLLDAHGARWEEGR